MNVLPACMSVHCVLRDQKRASDPLGLDLQMAMCCHVGAGNQTWISTEPSLQLRPIRFFSDPANDSAIAILQMDGITTWCRC